MTSGPPPHLAAPTARLLCATRWPGHGSAMDALLARRPASLARAADLGIRCASLHAAGWLAHWMEGPATAVRSAWADLRTGSAGLHPILLHESHGPAGLGEPVQLASLYTGGSGAEVARRLHGVARQHEEGWPAEPLEAWQALAAPCLRSDPASVERVGRRQVLVLGARDQEAIDLVRDVAHGLRARLGYQRYAGSDPRRADVGAVYTDVPGSPATVLRLHAVSRSALGAGAALLGVAVPEHVLLLLGADAARAQALLRDAAAWLAMAPRRPVLHVVAADAAVVDAALGAVPTLADDPHWRLRHGTGARDTALGLLAALARPPTLRGPAAGGGTAGGAGRHPAAAAC